MNVPGSIPDLSPVLVSMAVQSMVLALFGLAGTLFRGAAVRHEVLLTTMLCLLVSPAFVGLAGWVGVSIPVPIAFGPSTKLTHSTQVPRPPVAVHRHVGPQRLEREKANTEKTTPAQSLVTPRPAGAAPKTIEHFTGLTLRWDVALAVCWLLGSLVWLAFLLCAAAKSQRILRTARPLTSHALAAADEAADKLGVQRFPNIAATLEVSGPTVAGVFGRPTILLPPRFIDSVASEELVQVLVHEGAHAIRRDPLFVLLQRLCGALYWWHPLVHLVHRRLDRAREEVCDNHVLRHTEPCDFGATLLRLSTVAAGNSKPHAAVGLWNQSWKLDDRIAGILDERRQVMTRIPVSAAVAMFLGFVLLAIGASGRLVAAQDKNLSTKAAGPKDKSAVDSESNVAKPNSDPAVALANRVDRQQHKNARPVNEQGLVTLLSSKADEYRAGQPIAVDLVVANNSDQTKEFGKHIVSLNNMFEVVDGRGNPAPHVGGTSQIREEPVALEAGKVMKIESFDLASKYYLRKPGTYTVSYRGGGLPASNAISLKVIEDPGAADGDPVGRLLPLARETWSLIGNPNGGGNVRPGGNRQDVPGRQIIFQDNPTGVIRDVALVWVWLTDKAAEEKPGPADPHPPSSQYLGMIARWHVYIHVSEKAAQRWPTVKEDVVKALKSQSDAS